MAGGIGAQRLRNFVADGALQFLHREAPALYRALKLVVRPADAGLCVHLELMLYLCGERILSFKVSAEWALTSTSLQLEAMVTCENDG